MKLFYFLREKKTPVNHIICFIRWHINIIFFYNIILKYTWWWRIQYFPRERSVRDPVSIGIVGPVGPIYVRLTSIYAYNSG